MATELHLQPTLKLPYLKPGPPPPPNPQRMQFEHEVNGKRKRVSVAQYFKSQYSVDLQDDYLPCIKVGAGGKAFLPPEVCEVVPKQVRSWWLLLHSLLCSPTSCKPGRACASHIAWLLLATRIALAVIPPPP